jgi:prepilin-type N-terminal cleavage/methylation domain-containing protein
MDIKHYRTKGFTLLEIMIVVAIIGLMAMIAFPALQKARGTSQANSCMNNMRQIEAAKEEWAFEYRKSNGASVTWTNILPYLKSQPICPAGGDYEEWVVGSGIYCTIHDWRPQYQGGDLQFEELRDFHP